MHEVLKRIGDIGVVPVVKIDNAADAVSMGRALLAGDLPLAEITFRTAAAEEAIGNLSRDVPDLLVGAGTILTVDQVKRAVDAGARFIVSPGFNPKVVDYCLANAIAATPGVCTPTEIEAALERGLDVVKLFPAGASGGLEYLKAVAAPYGSVKFIPTGGVDATNLRDYLSFKQVFAVGGTWIAKDTSIAAGKFDEITRLAREAVSIALGFELAHIGVNDASAESARADAEEIARLFGFGTRDGTSSVFAGTAFEFMKAPYLGSHGHIGISTLSVTRAIAFLKSKLIATKPETAKEKDGKLNAIYLEKEICGFALHLLQKP